MKPRAFAYPATLLTLFIIALLSLHLLGLFKTHMEVDHSWNQLDQASLNCASAVNHFLRVQTGFHSFKGSRTLEFEQGIGFSYRALPLGMFWLLDIRGYSGIQEIQIRRIVGGATNREPLLHLGHPMKDVVLAKDATLNGMVAFDTAQNINVQTGHTLASQAEIKSLPIAAYANLAQHLQAPFTQEWLETLKTMFPEIKVRTNSYQVDLEQLNDKSPLILVQGENIRLTGEYRNRAPLIILAGGEIEAPSALGLNNCWIISKEGFHSRISLTGHNIHILSPLIEILGEVEMTGSTLSAVPTPALSQTAASLKLSGRGSYNGALVALSPTSADDSQWLNRGTPFIEKERLIDSSGYVFCDGGLAMRGQHQGAIRTRVWDFRDRQASFPGRISDINLTTNPNSSVSVWGIGGQKGSVLHSWEAK